MRLLQLVSQTISVFLPWPAGPPEDDFHMARVDQTVTGHMLCKRAQYFPGMPRAARPRAEL